MDTPTPAAPILVFVYGTLQRGEANHRHLRDQKLIGARVTPRRFTMYDLGGFPAVVPEGAQRIEGELYEVTPEALASCDRLEGHPTFYRRTEITLATGERAWIYLFNRDLGLDRDVIPGGCWRDR